MQLLGALVNGAAICVGGGVGLVLKNGLKEQYRDMLIGVMGLSVLFSGISTAMGGLLDEAVEPLLFIVSLVLGGLVGQAIGIERHLEAFGDWMQSRLGNGGGNFSQGCVTASLTFCVGTMAILGSLESGIQGVHTTLFTKSIIDGITALIFASTLGVGVLFSAVPVVLYQGALTLLAVVVEPYLSADIIREISVIGGILIAAIGMNMLEIRRFQVGNLLPAIVVPVLYYLPVQAFLGLLFGR